MSNLINIIFILSIVLNYAASQEDEDPEIMWKLREVNHQLKVLRGRVNPNLGSFKDSCNFGLEDNLAFFEYHRRLLIQRMHGSREREIIVWLVQKIIKLDATVQNIPKSELTICDASKYLTCNESGICLCLENLRQNIVYRKINTTGSHIVSNKSSATSTQICEVLQGYSCPVEPSTSVCQHPYTCRTNDNKYPCTIENLQKIDKSQIYVKRWDPKTNSTKTKILIYYPTVSGNNRFKGSFHEDQLPTELCMCRGNNTGTEKKHEDKTFLTIIWDSFKSLGDF